MYKEFVEEIKASLFIKCSIWLFILFFLILEIIVGYEVVTLKENIIYSKGDCRVVNMKLALDNKYNILIIKNKTNNQGGTHLIGIDQNNILHDVSKKTNMDNQPFSKYKDEAIILFSNKNSFFSNIYNFDISENIFYYNYRIFFFCKQLFMGFY